MRLRSIDLWKNGISAPQLAVAFRNSRFPIGSFGFSVAGEFIGRFVDMCAFVLSAAFSVLFNSRLEFTQ